MIPNAMFWATTYFSLLLGARIELEGGRHGLHPLAELRLVVQQVGRCRRLAVLVLGAPEQRVERQTSTQMPQYMHSA